MTENLPSDLIEVQAVSKHLDGAMTDLVTGGLLQNQYTKMGLQGQAQSTGVKVGQTIRLDEFELRSLYSSSWLLGRVVDLPAEDMTKAGFELDIPDYNSDQLMRLMGMYQSIIQNESIFDQEQSGDDLFCEAERWARLYGQSYIVVQANANEDPSLPLRKIRSIEGLKVLDRYQLMPALDEIDLVNPKYYQLSIDPSLAELTRGGRRIHCSRVLKFIGHPLPRIDAIANHGCADSVIRRMFEVFSKHYSVKDAVAEGLNSFSLMSVAISGLASLIGAGKLNDIKSYLREVGLNKSLHGILLTDSEVAKPGLMERSFSGVNENVMTFIEELTAASGLSFYKLWGTIGRAGLGDSHDAEEQAHADWIYGQQMARHHKNHRRLLKMLMALEFGSIPDNWNFNYRPIRKLNDLEKVAYYIKQAERIEILNRAGAGFSSDEIKLIVANDGNIKSVIDVDLIENKVKKMSNDNDQNPEDSETKNKEDEENRVDEESPTVTSVGKVLSTMAWDDLAKVKEVDILETLGGITD